MVGVSVERRGARDRERHATYVDLVSSGVGCREAGRRVGVSPSTVRRWEDPELAQRQADRGRERAAERDRERVTRIAEVAATVAGLPARADRSRYLSLAERVVIADHYRDMTQTELAGLLERDKSSISRELARNSYAHPVKDVPSARRYGAYAADRAAAGRRARPKPGKLEVDQGLHQHVQDKLTTKWSPEQIARTLPRVFPDQPERHVCHETIYQALYVQGRGQLRREVRTWLRSGRATRRPRRRPQARTPRFTEPMVMISERPAEVADRAVPGHWEGDLIVGENNGSAIATLVERTTRFTMLVALPHGRDAVSVRDALIAALQSLPDQLARSLTWDQGSEMARHHEVRAATDVEVYFCDPASPWMRGSNENTNGLLRQYFPKGTDLSEHTPEHLAAVAAELNARPRKTLDWDTPAERLATVLEQASQQRCCDHP